MLAIIDRGGGGGLTAARSRISRHGIVNIAETRPPVTYNPAESHIRVIMQLVRELFELCRIEQIHTN